jgi:hypothetical protein
MGIINHLGSKLRAIKPIDIAVEFPRLPLTATHQNSQSLLRATKGIKLGAIPRRLRTPSDCLPISGPNAACSAPEG